MKNILLSFLFLFSYKAQAQVLDTLPWAPKGATWLYYGSFFGGEVYDKFVYTSDTTILNKKVKKISNFEFEILKPTLDLSLRTKESFVKDYFFYESNDSVFWFNKTQFDLLYVFNAQVGNSWKVPKNNFVDYSANQSKCIDSFNIDSNRLTVTGILKNDFSGKKFNFYQTSGQNYWILGAFIKNIGAIHAPLIPITNQKCSGIDQFLGVPTELFCYSDNLRGYISISGYTDCRGLITSNSDLKLTEQNFRISPNPVNSTLHIENHFDSSIKFIKIFDLVGREFISIQNYSNTDINVAQLPNGFYVLKALTADNNYLSVKFVKSE